jgi:hypothetical protein
MAAEYRIKVGDICKPNGWKFGELLQADDGFKDGSFPGCQFRLPTGRYTEYGGVRREMALAVNVRITGRVLRDFGGKDGYTCEIEFVGDDEPSTFDRGIIFPN